MRYSLPLVAALATSVTANAAIEERAAPKLFTLELAPGQTVEVTEDEKFQMIDDHIHFFDITEWKDHQPAEARLMAARAYPTTIKHRSNVEGMVADVDIEKIRKQIGCFSTFHNRYFNSRYGVEAAQWLHAEINKMVDESGQPLASVRMIQHQAWSQPSIIVSIPGKVRLKTVIVGSHLDSVISGDRGAGRAPGADDNASGSIMLLNVLGAFLRDPRILAGDHANTIEFHWYSAEETGLLGSQDIFNSYARLGIQVEAMLNQDMVGYAGRDGNERFGLITDFSDAGQNEFIKTLINEYADIPYEEVDCGYACSDHASANRNGFPSTFLFEAPFGNHNPFIHSPNDTIDKLSFPHIMEHVKVTSGFLYELAHHDFVTPPA